MADLYFKVNADYEELVRMQQEADRLKNELAEASTKADFTRLTNELGTLQDKMRELAENGAQNFIDKFKEMDDGTPDFFKGFDSAFATFSSNAVGHFDTMKQQYIAMMNELLDKADELERNGNAPKMLEQVRDLTDEVEKQIAVCERGKEIWSGMYDAASVDALDIVKEQRAEEEKKLAVMEQELETLRQQAEASKMSLGEKFIGRFVAPEYGVAARGNEAEAQAALEQATQAYEAQKQVVAELRAEEESLSGQLSATAQAQVEEATAAEQAAADRQAYIEKLRETQSAAGETKVAIQEVVGEGTAADRALQMDSLKDGFNQATQSLQELKDELTSVLQQYKDAQTELSNLESKMMGGDTSINVEDVEAARAKVAELRQGLEDTALAYNNINGQVQEYRSQLDQASGHQVRMRTQIMNAREEMMQLIAAGQQGSPAFQQLAQKAGEMRRQMNLANASMQYFANPTRHLAALKQGLQGVAGATGLVTGAMGLFNSESKKMQEIQTKIQSVMAIIVGLETVYNTVKKTSTVMLALQEAGTMGLTAAREAETVATQEATVAQTELDVAMTANPIGAIIVAIVAYVAILATLASAIYDVVNASGEAKKMEEERKELDEFRKQQTEEFTQTFSRSAAEQIAKYTALKNEWNKLKTAQEKNKFIKDNKKAFNEFGKAIDNTSDATAFFSGPSTKAFIAACTARAKAMAYTTAASNAYAKAIEAEFKAESATKTIDYLKKMGAQVTGDDLEGSIKRFFDLKDSMLHQLEQDRKSNERLAKTYKAEGDAMIKKAGEAQAEADVAWKGVGGRDYTGSGGGKKGGGNKKGGGSSKGSGSSTEKKIDQSQANKDDKEFKREEDLRRRRVNAQKKNLQQLAQNEQDAQKKKEYQHKLALLEAKEYYRNLLMEDISYAKSEYDEKNAQKDKKVSFYKTDEFKEYMDKLNADEFGPKGSEEADKFLHNVDLGDYEAEINALTELQRLENALAKDEEFYKSNKALEQFFAKRVKIEKEYLDKQQRIEEAFKSGVIDEGTKDKLLTGVKEQKEAALEKEAFKNYKNSPLLEVAMSDTSMNYSQLAEVRKNISEMLSKAMENAEPEDYKGILDSYVQITETMIEKNPFGELKASAEELRVTTKALEDEQKKLKDLYEKTGYNEKGEETGEIKKQHDEADNAAQDMRKAQEVVDEATRKRSEAYQAFLASTTDGSTEEEQMALSNALAAAIDNEKTAMEKAQAATQKFNTTQQKYADTKSNIVNQENRVRKANQAQMSAQNRNTKATKKATDVVREWGNALKEAAEMFDSPIASAISGMVNLTSTTLDSIQAMKQSGYGAAKGVEKVAIAVQNAVAILAIIQAAWQVISTIMELFQGEDTEQKRIDLLQSKIKALDYQFNKLKEDMDKAWGTEAIDAYARAVDALTEKQKTSMEVIQAKAGKSKNGFLGVGGHHSLEYQMNKIIGSNALGGITNAELEAAKRVLQSLGVDTSKGNLLDWIYQLSPENMATFLASTAGNAVAAKLGAVTSSGDYQGSDWLSDLQNYASTAKDAEDVTLAMAEKLNGISLDGLKDEFKTLVTTMTTSLNDINNSFDAFMREAMYNKLRDKYEEQVESFNEELKDLNDQYTRGEMSDEEYRKRLQALRDKWKKETREAQDEYQAQLTAAGVNAEDVEQSSTSGGFEAMSEDTATELNGRFASMQAMETVTAEGITQLVGMQTNIVSIADEIRNVQVNSYLELQAISENTRKMVNPILEIQDNVKLIKENTDKL